MPHDRLSVLTALEAQGVCPVFYHADPEVCLNVIRACARGGAPTVEFTNRGDFAVDLFGEIARELQKTDPDVIPGIGRTNRTALMNSSLDPVNGITRQGASGNTDAPHSSWTLIRMLPVAQPSVVKTYVAPA